MPSTPNNWFKSSHSGSEGGACVEIALTPDGILVRDSKTSPLKPVTLKTTPTAWSKFIETTTADPA